jgi:hypothetical protein
MVPAECFERLTQEPRTSPLERALRVFWVLTMQKRGKTIRGVSRLDTPGRCRSCRRHPLRNIRTPL